MPQQNYRVFISYSRRNEDQKKRLLIHLDALAYDDTIRKPWHDRLIGAGDIWRDELNKAMKEAEVALFLVSADFIASPFCQDVEVPQILERHENEGVLIVPIIVGHCSWKHIEWLSRFQILPEDGKPVTAQVPRDKAWTQVIEALRWKLENKPPAKKAPAVTPRPLREVKPPKLSLQKLLQDLPGESGKLFGREEGLGWLDAAYADSKAGVLALVGFGGVGKSALVRHWLETRFRPEAPAPRFLGVSFYSQGTREQAGSSDQFLVQALETFGEQDVGQMSAWDRGERLAGYVAAKPTVLVLDGLEPLQHGPGPHNLEGRLKDPGVHALLARFAKQPSQSLCVVSTRVGLKDDDLQTPSCVQKSVEVLSPEAARELLISRGVRGSEEELDEAADHLGRHPLALVLAAEYLHTFAEGQVSHLYEIDILSEKTKEGRHAKSVMAAYETALRRDGSPLDLELLGVIGLFDRPMRWEWLKALAAPTAIEGVTDHLSQTSERELWESINRLRQWGMLADLGSLEQPDLDAHPLIREYFGEKLRSTNEAGWRAAHSRMFDYLTANTKEFPDTLEEMEPLYQAVAHGCAAGKYQEALGEVYWRRIRRGAKAFNLKTLGTFGTSLAALTGFFAPPWQQPVATLNEDWKAFILNQAGFVLRALGRSLEATQSMQAALEARITQGSWRNAAANASHLSELYLITGDLSQAFSYAQKSIELADRSGDARQRVDSITTMSDALYRAGRSSESEVIMRKAEEMQKDLQPQIPFLYSLRGFGYCALLLHQGKYQEVQTRAAQTLELTRAYLGPLDIALDYLSLGRAFLLQARHEATDDFLHATDYLDQAVNGLRQAGQLEYLYLGLLAHAELHRVKGEFERARGDLDEAMSIASRGSMRLHQADCHLEYARLHLAQGEMDEAREHLLTAREMIERMGYHLRDEEVRELERELGEKADG